MTRAAMTAADALEAEMEAALPAPSQGSSVVPLRAN